MLIRMKFYIKSHVRLYNIQCSLVFFLTSIRFIRYKVAVMVLICTAVIQSRKTGCSHSLTIAQVGTDDSKSSLLNRLNLIVEVNKKASRICGTLHMHIQDGLDTSKCTVYVDKNGIWKRASF